VNAEIKYNILNDCMNCLLLEQLVQSNLLLQDIAFATCKDRTVFGDKKQYISRIVDQSSEITRRIRKSMEDQLLKPFPPEGENKNES
jgi:formiminotetrahydrofolate cyclodeaminase